MSTYLIGFGTTLNRKGGSPAAYTAITQVSELTPPPLTMGTAETTHLVSSAREFIPTIPDGGEVQFMLEYNPDDATHLSLYSDFTTKASGLYKIDLAGTTTNVWFTGFVVKFGIDQLTVDGVVKIPVTIRTTGLPEYAVSAPTGY